MPKIIEDEIIFNAVIQAILERGYAGATTKQIAEAANVNEVTLFRKYGNKLQLVKQAIAAIVKENDFVSATQYTGDLRADLLRVLEAYQGSVALNSSFFSVLSTEISRNPELLESFDQPLRIFNAIVQLLERYQVEGQLRKEHPIIAIAALLGPFTYIAMITSTILGNLKPSLDLQHHVNLFLEGHSNRPIDSENEILRS